MKQLLKVIFLTILVTGVINSQEKLSRQELVNEASQFIEDNIALIYSEFLNLNVSQQSVFLDYIKSTTALFRYLLWISVAPITDNLREKATNNYFTKNKLTYKKKLLQNDPDLSKIDKLYSEAVDSMAFVGPKIQFQFHKLLLKELTQGQKLLCKL